MENKLQKILKRFNEKNFNWNEYDKVMDYFKKVLNNYETITDDEIKTLILFQEEYGGFSLVDDKFKTHLSWEAKQDLIYFPSYYVTLILVKYSNLSNSKIYQEEIKKALDFCSGCKFYGHGYDNVKTQIEVANLFVENGIKKYIKNNNLAESNMSKLLNKLVEIYTQMILEGNTKDYIAGSYLEGMERFINNMDDAIYYVAYGSNLNKKQMMERCPEAECVCSSILKNYKLKFNLYLTVEPQENSIVPVGLWKISKNDEKALDRYEGCSFGLYRKEYITLKIGGINKKCLIYIMNDILERKDVPPTRLYLEKCKRGYEDFGFNPNDLDKYL